MKMVVNDNSCCKVHVIKEGFLQFANYIYIGIDTMTKKAFAVDPAWNISVLEKVLKEEDLELDKILLTHSHVDHINMAAKLAAKHNVPVYMSQKEIDFYNFKCRNLRAFEDMEQLELGSQKITCMVTSGHTKGSTCFEFGNNLFTGDTIFIEGCGICVNPGASADEMFDSIKRLAATVPEDEIIYPGHCYGNNVGQTMKFVKKHNLYFQIDDREQFVKYRNRSSFSGAFHFK